MKYFIKHSVMFNFPTSKTRLWFFGVKTVLFTLCIMGILLITSANSAELVSANSAGTDSGNDRSEFSEISADGRFVVFSSLASDLVTTDTNGEYDVFVRDLQAGVTTLASVNSAGTGSGNGGSSGMGISADGRFIAFNSNASDLVAMDTNGMLDVFVRDLQTRTTTLVSTNSAGTDSGNASSFSPVISANGRFVVFKSNASDLEATDTDLETDLFVRDLQTEITKLVSINSTGTDSSNGFTGDYRISGDGRFVAFDSVANDLVATDTNQQRDVFVRDLQAGTTTLVSINSAGSDSGNGISGTAETDGGDRISGEFRITADGRFVVFTSSASDLVATNTDTLDDVFVRDLQTRTTTKVSVNSSGIDSGFGTSFGPTISADGRFVAFTSFDPDLVATGISFSNVFVRDLQIGTTTLVNVNSAVSSHFTGEISANGRFVVFSIGGTTAIYMRELQAGTTTLVSINNTGTGSGNGIVRGYSISNNGRFVVFQSEASDLVTTDTNGVSDIFVFKAPKEPLLINDALNLNNVITSFDPTPCGGTASGTFTISATFKNTTSDTLSGISFKVDTLTGGNVLCNANGGPGGVGSTLSVPSEDLGGDGVLTPGKSFTLDFDIGLNSLDPFQFLVDAFGVEE